MLDKTKELLVREHINSEWNTYQFLHFELIELKQKAPQLHQKVIDILYVYFDGNTDKTRMDTFNAMSWIVGTFIKQVKL